VRIEPPADWQSTALRVTQHHGSLPVLTPLPPAGTPPSGFGSRSGAPAEALPCTWQQKKACSSFGDKHAWKLVNVGPAGSYKNALRERDARCMSNYARRLWPGEGRKVFLAGHGLADTAAVVALA
jgi:hypothetical protein